METIDHQHVSNNDNIIILMYKDFVTKEDFREFKSEVRTEFKEIRQDMKTYFYALVGLISFFFGVVPNWQSIKAWFI